MSFPPRPILPYTLSFSDRLIPIQLVLSFPSYTSPYNLSFSDRLPHPPCPFRSVLYTTLYTLSFLDLYPIHHVLSSPSYTTLSTLSFSDRLPYPPCSFRSVLPHLASFSAISSVLFCPIPRLWQSLFTDEYLRGTVVNLISNS